MTDPKHTHRPLFELSVVVPMHNAMEKMHLCVASLESLSAWAAAQERPTEIIIVDDASTDGTFETLTALATSHSAWHVHQLPENTGSPSTPRNVGLTRAQGEFVFFLDGDDAIQFDGIAAAMDLARERGLDVVRGPVVVNYVGKRKVLLDRITVPDNATGEDVLRLMTEGQSLNCSALWRRSFLAQIEARFDTAIRMGEDLAFTSHAMARTDLIGYVDQPLFEYVRHPGGGDSSMHTFTGRELRELAHSWRTVEAAYDDKPFSFLNLRGDKTINYALRQAIRNLRPEAVSDQDLLELSRFFQEFRTILTSLDYADRHVAELVKVLSEPLAVSEYRAAFRPRLVIAGHDLKFILPALPKLRTLFEIRIDEWPSEVRFDQSHSDACLAWADYVWVEWLTAASVWYAERVRPTQELVTRFHRYELGRSYGDAIRRESVTAFVAIAPHCFEDLVERFDIPRSQVRYIPNFYFVDDYEQADPNDSDRLFRLAMIGSVPKRKGFLKALELLRELRSRDGRYQLHVMGKRAAEIPWIGGDPLERAYFDSCDSYIAEHDLQDSITYHGWVDTKAAVKDYGWVLSMSEHEGSHVGPGEAYCAGNQAAFLPWRGVEFIYPGDAVFSEITDMANHIRSMQDLDAFNLAAQRGRQHMKDQFDIDLFVSRVDDLFRSFN